MEGDLVLVRNSARDSRKGGKLNKRWLGPYTITSLKEKGLYRVKNPHTGRDIKKLINGCRYIIIIIIHLG